MGQWITGMIMTTFALMVIYPEFFLGILAMYITGGILLGIAKILE